MENSPILHLKYLYFDVSLYFYYICPGATDSVNMSEVDSVVENFVRDALSQCDQSTVSETFKRVHSEGCFLGRKLSPIYMKSIRKAASNSILKLSF